MEGVDETERFLWDYRRTIGDLLADNFYGAFGDYIRPHGLKLSAEAPGIGIPIHGDYIQMQGKMDIPMGEFWRNTFNSAWSCIEAASIGHVMGKPVVAAEAFTAVKTSWKESPWTLKDQGDHVDRVATRTGSPDHRDSETTMSSAVPS